MDTVFADNPMAEQSIQAAIIEYISSLNEIYETSILQNPPNQNMYFRLQGSYNIMIYIHKHYFNFFRSGNISIQSQSSC